MGKKICTHCGSPHHPSTYHTEKYISSEGYPVHDKNYKSAHEQATKKEKEKFPKKDYDKLKHLDESISKKELIGKNTKKGRIIVSEKVKPSLRDEVAFHEKVESKILRKKKA